MDGASLNLKKIKQQQLYSLFPEIFDEGKIDWEKLKATLGEDINFSNERYVLNWAGKSEAFRVLQQPSSQTLVPAKNESVDFDTTKNIFIEGENLEVLKVLQKSYFGKIKMIYIDPPYNTGNDSFIYPDKFSESKEEYRQRVGDLTPDPSPFGEGKMVMTREGMFRKNSKENGQYHSNWLNMMMPRLYLAKNLLREDGVIFISIDDNEVHNLRLLMNEIFGEEDFVAQFPWRKRTAKSDVPFGVSQDYEWVLCYAKPDFIASIENDGRKYYETPDFPNRPWRVHDLTKQTSASERPNSFFTIVNPKDGKEYPADSKRTWAITDETFQKYYHENRIVFPDDYDFLNISRPVLRYWKEDDMKKAGENFGRIAVSTKFPDNIGMSQDGTKEITDLLEAKAFSFPKPVNLIKHLINVATNHSSLITSNSQLDIILDFFAGSATTAHAVMQLNKEDGGNRQFICVQMPELCDENSEAYKAGYKNIAEISKERIRRAGKSLTPNPSPIGEGNNGSGEVDMFKGATPDLFSNARRMRIEDKTEAEDKLWQCLRNRQVEGCKFRRQHPLGQFIVDFYCHEKKLAIEVDGGYHNLHDQVERDKERTKVINKYGIQIIRFTNEQVLSDINNVIKHITAAISTPSPSGEGRGEVDLGFKVLKLQNSNFKQWRQVKDNNIEELEEQMEIFIDPVAETATVENMVYELLLKSGKDLNSPIEHKEGYYCINNDELVLMLESASESIIEAVIAEHPQKVIALDRLFEGNDQLKTNTALQMRDNGVEFKTI